MTLRRYSKLTSSSFLAGAGDGEVTREVEDEASSDVEGVGDDVKAASELFSCLATLLQ